MNFDPQADSAEAAAFRAEVRAWLAEQLAPAAGMHWSASWSTRENEAEYAFRRELGRRLGRRGWLFPTYPEQYGGAGLTPEHQIVLESEVARYGLNLSHIYYTLARIAAPCILTWGTEEQRLAFLPPMCRGEVVAWQVLTEPQGGSDVATCRTTALRDGDRYVVNGQKTMVGHFKPPDFLWTLVCTDPQGARHENLGWLHIPADAPGITIRHLPMMMGIKNTIFFDNVSVPAFNLVGGENNGWRVSSTHMELEHGGAGNISGDAAVDHLLAYCEQTVEGGRRLIDRDEVREICAEAIIESHANHLMGLRNFWHRLSHIPHSYGGPQYRYFNRMVRLNNTHRMQRILGYRVLLEDREVHEDADFEHLVRSGPGQLHGGGTLDTDRLIFARRLGLGRRAQEQAPLTL